MCGKLPSAISLRCLKWGLCMASQAMFRPSLQLASVVCSVRLSLQRRFGKWGVQSSSSLFCWYALGGCCSMAVGLLFGFVLGGGWWWLGGGKWKNILLWLIVLKQEERIIVWELFQWERGGRRGSSSVKWTARKGSPITFGCMKE